MLLESKNIQYTHPGQQTMAFPDIKLNKGESILVLGKSGSRKTTLLNLLAGLLSPKTGTISLAGTNLSELKGLEFQEKLRKHFIVHSKEP